MNCWRYYCLLYTSHDHNGTVHYDDHDDVGDDDKKGRIKMNGKNEIRWGIKIRRTNFPQESFNIGGSFFLLITV